MIELKNVRRIYKGVETGLYDESAIIKKGEIVGILGENGSGKTTMLKAIMGLLELDHGEVLIGGKKVESQYEKMSFITEEGSYFPHMTGYEYGKFLQDFFPKFDNNRFREIFKLFHLDPYKKIKTFSTGQRAKVEIAAGFSKGAEYIIMDEPFMGSDMFTRRDFLKLMISSLRSNETILISTHLIDEIENFIDRAIILKFGKIKADFYIDDIRHKGKTLEDMMIDIIGYKTI
ncbi:MAG: ABC transporter ATP-binding protein [Clostridiales bacterium]|nr:ABC transporter ATP-binding protein [Clostridiales bacterium]